MEVELTPCLRCKELNAGIESCREGYDDSQQRWVQRVDVVEVYDMCVLLQYLAGKVSHGYDRYDNQEDEQVDIRKSRDKLRNGIVRINLLQQMPLMDPSKSIVLRGYLYPD